MCNMFLMLVVLNSVLCVCCSKDVTLVRDVRNDRESSENDMRIDKIMQDLQDTCIHDNQHQTVKKLKKDTQTILYNIEVYKDVVKLNTKLRKEVKWIIEDACVLRSREGPRFLREGPRLGHLHTENILMICFLEASYYKKNQKEKGKPEEYLTYSNRTQKYKDCTELKKKTKKKLNDGVYKIYPGGESPVQAYCDMTTDGGGWTVMLKRYKGSVSFKRKWIECENGFGDMHGDFWFGNKYTHMLTSSGKYELRVDMIDVNNKKKYAVYKTFVIGDAASKYKLTVGDYSGTTGDQFKNNNGMKFTTVDQDNDIDHRNCAVAASGSWWYNDCGESDLTRSNYKPYWGGIISKPVMMIRKI